VCRAGNRKKLSCTLNQPEKNNLKIIHAAGFRVRSLKRQRLATVPAGGWNL
jgi:hypothetical protein